jgi:hypothetical protein
LRADAREGMPKARRSRAEEPPLSASTTEAVSREALVTAARRAFQIAERLDWKSYDPFDVLLSPYTRGIQARSPLAARGFVQMGKRSGYRLRRFLKVPRHEEPKALADFLRAAVILAQSGETWANEHVAELSHRLRSRAVMTPHGRGWSLEFPYVSRFGTLEQGAPNIYTTTTACQALLDDHDLNQRRDALEAAREGSAFILEGLGSFEYGGKRWLRYVSGLSDPIVNVQASGASLFARIGDRLEDDRILAAADIAAETVVACQRSDGSWPYSADGRASFVDGFHTGFTLQGLAEYASLRTPRIPDVERALRSGVAYFKEHLITREGLPRGFADGRVSLDGQNVGQCIQTLIICGGADSETRNIARLWRIGLEARLLTATGGRARFPALRWTLGPAVLATAFLLRATAA